MLVNWLTAVLAVWPMSQLGMGSPGSGRKPNFGLKTGTYFSITMIFGSWDPHFCDLLGLRHMLVVSQSDLSTVLLGVTLSVKAGEGIQEGRVTTTHILLIRKTKALLQPSGLLLTSHWLELCCVEQQKSLGVAPHSSALDFCASVVDSIVWATSGRFSMLSLCFSASGIAQELWKILATLKQWGRGTEKVS